MHSLFCSLTAPSSNSASAAPCAPVTSAVHIFGNEAQTQPKIYETYRQTVASKDEQPWRPENRGALVPRGNANDSSLSGQLLYAATHVDKTQRRNIANLIAKERLYRRLFCGQTQYARAPRTVFGHRVIKREENDEDKLDESLVNGDLSFIKYRDTSRELNLETLCLHIEQLIDLGYSLTYIFAYLSYLRRKYRSAYPKFGRQTSAFYRTLIDNYERKVRVQPRIGTDEVYTCEDELYESMYQLANDYYFSTAIDAQLTSDRMIFTYVFLFMYYTGKRLSELSLIGREQMATLLKFDALVIRIPKCKKLGRIVLRGYDADTLERFKRFLARSLELFDRVTNARTPPLVNIDRNDNNHDDIVKRIPTYHDIPFDQFSKRRLLDDNFALLYAQASRRLFGRNAKKPRGLSLHSLRRYRAATMFAQGKEIDHIRECLDHSSVRVTNTYINKHLMRSYRKQTRAKIGDTIQTKT